MLKKIAYLAPEIPSLSETFVYREILALQKRNVEIIPISVHSPKLIDENPDIQELLQKTFFLYRRSFLTILLDNLIIFQKNPLSYFCTLDLVLKDIISIGLIKLNSLKLFYHFLQANSVAKLLINSQCEHLHIHFANVPTQIGMYAASLSKITFTFTSHANDLFENRLLLSQKVNRSKFAITISEYNRNFLVKQTNQPEKIKVVRCGIALDQYPFSHHTKSTNKKVIKSLGRLVEKKGMKTLILAINNLNNQGQEFLLEIGGDGELKEELKSLVVTYGLESKVHFQGAIPNHQVFSWIDDSDIFVLACQQDSQGDQDGIPVVLMEAMSIGVPVISTKISGIAELIEDGVTGYLAEPNNPDSLADKINQVFNDSVNLSKITQQARQKIEQKFNIDIIVNHLLTYF
ncbi:MAG TPA: colanic acid biosynthesis glycosyltransferase WcaL [Cyanothece sp. UBA12306]|nr:colanic acid biosynthesis glycosyltransferase WcaL [Cyanothece sp. UBA12306]